MAIIGRIIVLAVFFGVWLTSAFHGGWLTSAAVAAESVLQQLEQAIRSKPPHESAVAPQRAAATMGAEAPTQHVGSATARLANDAQQAGQQPQSAGYLGAVADDTNDRGRGVRVIEVRPGSPAERAGLKPQDLITGVAGTRVRELSDMASILSLFAPGDTITIDVRRGEQTQQIKVTLGTRPAGASPPPGQPIQPPVASPPPSSVPTESPPQQPPTGPVLKLPEVAPPAVPIVPPAAEAKPSAQPVAIAELKALLVELQQRIEKLEARIARLEKALAEPPNKQ